MNSEARKIFAVLVASLTGTVGYWIGRLWVNVDSPSFEEFAGLMWPILMAIVLFASVLTLGWMATTGGSE